MKTILAAAAAVYFGVGAAQAAVYQYNMTLGLERFGIYDAFDTGFGETPIWAEAGDCTVSDDGFYGCFADYVDVLNGLSAAGLTLDNFNITSTEYPINKRIDATIILDSLAEGGTQQPVCRGPIVICGNFNNGTATYSASENGFSFSVADGVNSYMLDSEGYDFVAEFNLSAMCGESEINTSDGFQVFYATSSLSISEVAPVPLPASLPLLAFGAGALVLIRKHRSDPASKRRHVAGRSS